MIQAEISSDKSQQNSRKKLTKKSRRIIIMSVVCLLLISFIASLIISNFCIKVNVIKIDSEAINEPVRIAVISDLHRRKIGDFHKKVISKTEDENPDLIVLTGDILSSDSTKDNDFKYLYSLISSFKEIAPVYFVLGNHEKSNPHKDEIIYIVNHAGGTVLDGEYADISINGNSVRIGGLSYYRSWDEDANSFLKNFSSVSDDVYTLLLCHFPEFYLWGMKNHPIDLTICGHTHGGMMKVPFKGPLFAPEQGWFPDYAAGLYDMENGYLAVTTGLASSPEYLPRIFNRPEIMIIDLE